MGFQLVLKSVTLNRDVTKLAFEFDNVRTSNVFKQIRNSTNVLSVLLSNANSWKNHCSTTEFICIESKRAQTNLFFFLRFNLSHKVQLLNVQHNFCSAMCYTVLI